MLACRIYSYTKMMCYYVHRQTHTNQNMQGRHRKSQPQSEFDVSGCFENERQGGERWRRESEKRMTHPLRKPPVTSGKLLSA